MLKFGDEKGQLKCSFCGKTQDQVPRFGRWSGCLHL